jgi:hypothetical protein
MSVKKFVFCLTATTSLVAAATLSPSLSAQSLLVIPDLSRGSYQEPLAPGVVPASVDFDAIGVMDEVLSERFWGEASTKLLPGSRIALGSGEAALYTEIGAVNSGPWRFAVGTTLAVAGEEEETDESAPAEENAARNRFVAGGGSLSLQGIRPLVLAQLGQYSRGGLLFVPRGWINLPELTSSDDITDYGGELAGAVILQRHRNDGERFMTLETRSGWVYGSGDFYESVGLGDGSSFLYVAPTLTLAIQEQVNIGVSTFLTEGVKPSFRLSLSLLSKKD